MTWDLLAQFGLSGMIFGGFLCVLKWVFDINNKILADMANERIKAQDLYSGFIEQLRDLSVLNSEFRRQVRADHENHQKDHLKILENLTK